MELLTKEDLNINGAGSSSGGTFRRVAINGAGKLNGNVTCLSFEVNGAGTVNGNLSAQTVQISGSGKLNGSVTSTERIQIDGKGYIEKDVTIQKMVVNGLATIDGPIKGEDLEINGKITIKGDCEVERFKSEGIFKIKGLINADEVLIKVHGSCQANEIGGQDIRIRFKKSWFMKLLKPFTTFKLEASLIEGNNIELEGTHAKVVRGENIVIGSDCEIGLVEYTGTLKNSKGSIVKSSKKI